MKETWQKQGKRLFHRWQNRGKQENQRATMAPYLRAQLPTPNTVWVSPCTAAGGPRAAAGGGWLWLPILTKRHCSATCETSRGCSGTWRAALALPEGTQHPEHPALAPTPALLLAQCQLWGASRTARTTELLYAPYSLSLKLSPSWICSLQASGLPSPLIHLGMASDRAVPCPPHLHLPAGFTGRVVSSLGS